MADALALGASESNLMGVQVSPSAQINNLFFYEQFVNFLVEVVDKITINARI